MTETKKDRESGLFCFGKWIQGNKFNRFSRLTGFRKYTFPKTLQRFIILRRSSPVEPTDPVNPSH